VNVVLALLTIAAAGASLMMGMASPIYGNGSADLVPALDSNLRFLGGLGLGLGLTLLWITPSIERQGTLFRVVWGCAFLGGAGRIVSWLTVGAPPLPMLLFALIEVCIIPGLIYWQWRVQSS
jgi:hypothetical protein